MSATGSDSQTQTLQPDSSSTDTAETGTEITSGRRICDFNSSATLLTNTKTAESRYLQNGITDQRGALSLLGRRSGYKKSSSGPQDDGAVCSVCLLWQAFACSPFPELHCTVASSGTQVFTPAAGFQLIHPHKRISSLQVTSKVFQNSSQRPAHHTELPQRIPQALLRSLPCDRDHCQQQLLPLSLP